jgi:cell division septation protein DedD
VLPPRSTRQWAVQVAALATAKDAEAMAEFLRNSGYDSYVMVFENQGKTWHRVRVGKFADLRSAMQLKNSLTDFAQFKQAYVAGN